MDTALGGITCSPRLNAANLPRIAYGAMAVDSGSSTYVPSGVKYASFANSVALSFTVTGKTKRISSKPSITINGTTAEWRVCQKASKRVKINRRQVEGNVRAAEAGRESPAVSRRERRAEEDADPPDHGDVQKVTFRGFTH